MCSENNSSYSDETGLELGLGLGPSVTKTNKSSTKWCEYGRILTAKDFPNGFITRRFNNICTDENIGSASTSASQVVGWPPIRTYRMNSFNQSKITNADHQQEENVNKETESSNKKINHGINNTKNNDVDFVKVNMDGLPIGRKVNLSSHICYETLAKILEEMFFKSTKTTNCGEKEQVTKSCKLLDGSSEFVLTYEDKDGDWMLVGDVPWGMFLSNVKRLRIMRTTEAKGLCM
ncbi:auxin-regulated IAA5 [Solanum lycopersicum]|uniref:Auxin-responsive protein n=2 Tax=Solanum lycopersicum TaxID=4081 RepID=G9HPV9_SOLLC|nr:auxin-regulated IAA5 [Solanum lycopersicum]AEX00354.1 IAA11 [Solanum lycopersicum]